jgi:alanine dehydrogenase
MLLGEVSGRRYGKVMVIGDGTVGRHAARAAVGMGANVFLFSRNMARGADLKKAVSGDMTLQHQLLGGDVADLALDGESAVHKAQLDRELVQVEARLTRQSGAHSVQNLDHRRNPSLIRDIQSGPPT